MFSHLDIIFLLLVAVFIFMRLRNVLGTRPENEHKILVLTDEEFQKMKAKDLGSAAQEAANPEELSPLERTLAKIPGFYKTDFCNRAAKLTIQDAKVSTKGIAQIVVEFVSEQVNLLKNSAGEVIEGDENFVQKITDIWTFERDIHKASPVWLLVSTKKK